MRVVLRFAPDDVAEVIVDRSDMSFREQNTVRRTLDSLCDRDESGRVIGEPSSMEAVLVNAWVVLCRVRDIPVDTVMALRPGDVSIGQVEGDDPEG